MQIASHAGSTALRRFLSCPSVILSLMSTALLLASIPALAQLPAGAIDTTAPPKAAPIDPARAQANEALDKQDYPTAIKLLTPLAEKKPHRRPSPLRPRIQPGRTRPGHRRGADLSPRHRGPTLPTSTPLSPSASFWPAAADSPTPTTSSSKRPPSPPTTPLSKAERFAPSPASTRPANPSAASDELLSAIKITPETPEDILLSGELAEASGDPTAAELAYRRLLAVEPSES